MNNEEKLSKVIKALCLDDSSLQDLMISKDDLIIVLKNAEEYGLKISHNNGLYSLKNKINLLDKSIIYEHLKSINNSNIELSVKDFVDTTTQEFSQKQIKSDEIKISIAEFQKKGKGRQNRKWFSPFGSGICCSIFKHLPININPIGLSLFLGVSIIDALDEIGFHGIKLKWPNDLYFEEYKLGGILVDIYQNSDLESIISLGIGINYHLPDISFNYNSKNRPTDLRSIHKVSTLERSLVSGHLIRRVIESLDSFNNNSLNIVIERWKNIDHLYGKTITIESNNKQIIGISRGIASDGELVLEVDSERIKIITGHIVG